MTTSTQCWYIYRPSRDMRRTHPGQAISGTAYQRDLSEPANCVTADEVRKIYRSGLDKRTTLELKDGGIAYSNKSVRDVGLDLGFVK